MTLALVAAPFPGRANAVDPTFAGRLLVIFLDGDMEAQAHAGEVLSEPARDLLSFYIIASEGKPALAATMPVSKSVVGLPALLVLTPYGRYAIVVETRGSRPNRPDARLVDLPLGRAITVVQPIAGRVGPISVSVSPGGKLVAITYDTSKAKGASLDGRDFDQGRLDGSRSLMPPRFEEGDLLKHTAFVPNGPLAMVYATKLRCRW